MSTTTAQEYAAPRDQDAWGTIRGFVYQVSVTIQRWIGLTSHEWLELERGEDIDRVIAAYLATSDETPVRHVEQVKVRTVNLTLRQPSALEALSNAISHQQANPSHQIYFRYTTNAGIGRENGIEIDSPPLIERWQACRCKDLEAATHDLAVFRAFLKGLSRPDSIGEDTWDVLQTFVSASDEAALHGLVQRFDWAYLDGDPGDAFNRCVTLLINNKLADHPDVATELCWRLFWHVFTLLSQPGLKRLTSDELHQLLSTPTLSEAQHRVLSVIQSQFGRLLNLESRVDATERLVRGLAEDTMFGGEGGLRHSSITAEYELLTEPPPPPAHLVCRPDALATLQKVYESATWTALHGEEDIGKSTLSLEFARTLGSHFHWTKFGKRFGNPLSTLTSFLKRVCAQGQSTFDASALCDALRSLPHPLLIVADDLPLLSDEPELEDLLCLLVDSLASCGGHLITTSNWPVPARTLLRLGAGAAANVLAPQMSESEIAAVLESYGRPSTADPLNTRFLFGATGGHPVLVHSAAHYLRAHEWRIDAESFAALLTGNHAAAIADEALLRVVQAINGDASELLFRLCIVIGAFGLEEAIAVAAVPPEIGRTRATLMALDGPYLRRDTESQFRVSPLIRNVGQTQLSEAVGKGCHLSLAKVITSKPMSPFDASIAISHLVSGGEMVRAGLLFYEGLSQIRLSNERHRGRDLSNMWSSTPLPEQISRPLRIMIRGLQSTILAADNRPNDYVLSELDALISVEPQGSIAVVPASIHAYQALCDTDLRRSLGFLKRAIVAADEVRAQGTVSLDQPEDFAVEELAWFASTKISSAAEMLAWMEVLDALGPAGRDKLFSAQNAVDLALGVAVGVLTAARKRQAAGLVGESVVEITNLLENYADSVSAPLLRAAAIFCRLRWLAVDKQSIDEAVQFAADTYDRNTDQLTRYLVAQQAALFLFDADRRAEASVWMARAVQNDDPRVTSNRMATYLVATVLLGLDDPSLALKYSLEALNAGAASGDTSSQEYATALCEHATAQYLQAGSDPKACAVAWSRAGELVLTAKAESDRWFGLAMHYANATAFLCQMALYGELPEDAQNYPPEQGRFLRYNPDLAALYKAQDVGGVYVLLAEYLLSVGDTGRARYWYEKALHESSHDGVIAIAKGGLLGIQLQANDFGTALANGIDCIRRLAHSSSQLAGSAVPSLARVAAKAGKLDAVEAVSAIVITPIVMRICHVSLKDRVEAVRLGHSFKEALRANAGQPEIDRDWPDTADMLIAALGEKERYATIMTEERMLGKPPNMFAARAFIASLNATGEEMMWSAAMGMWYVSRQQSTSARTFLDVTLPYAEDLFERIKEASTFQMSSPRLVRRLMQEAQGAPASDRIRLMIRAMQTGLPHVSLPPPLWQWLDQP